MDLNAPTDTKKVWGGLHLTGCRSGLGPGEGQALLRHIHLQGYRDGNGHHPPLVEGDEIQWHEIFTTLAAIDYPGEFTFEPRGMLANLESLDYIGKAPERLAALQ